MILSFIIAITCANVVACFVATVVSAMISRFASTSTFTWSVLVIFFFLMMINTAHGIWFIQGLIPQVNTTYTYILMERFTLAAIANCIGMWGVMRIYYTLKARTT